MYYYRITKYNPKNRNELGWYTEDDWTEISDALKKVGLEVYTAIEDSYIYAIKKVMDMNSCVSFKIIDYCKSFRNNKKIEEITRIPQKMYPKIQENSVINSNDIDIILRLLLRHGFWARLEDEKMFVHFESDLYVYIGTQIEIYACKDEFQQKGIYLEYYVSPVLEWKAEGWYHSIEFKSVSTDEEIVNAISEVLDKNTYSNIIIDIFSIRFDENKLKDLKAVIEIKFPEHKKFIHFSV